MAYCDTEAGAEPEFRLITYARVPAALMAMPSGMFPVLTVAGLRAASAPLAPTEYCDTVLDPEFVAYANCPLGATFTNSDVVPAATVDGESAVRSPVSDSAY